MDISLGSYKNEASVSQRAKSIYRRLTTRAKVILCLLLLLFVYLIWPSSNSSSRKTDTPFINDGGNKEVLSSISNTLRNSGKFNKVALSYMGVPPLLDANAQYPNYENGGNMLLSRKGDYIRLINDNTERNGFITSRTPISNDDLNAIEIELKFKIHGEQRRVSLIGDGLAIWLTAQPIETGDVFGASSAWDGLGLFIDTYRNFNGKRNRNVFPYLSLQRNNGNPSFYDKSMDGIDSQLGGCSVADIYNNDNPSKMRITYIRSMNLFEISADIKGDGDWKVCFRREDSAVADYLPRGKSVYLSLSAETGQLHHIVDIHKIEVTSFKTLDNLDVTSLPAGSYSEDNIEDVNSNNGDTPEIRKPSRRTMKRLRRQEKKLREADYEKYGTDNGFVGWFFGWVWTMIKIVFQIILVLIVAYLGLLAFRVYKDKQKRKNSGGLL